MIFAQARIDKFISSALPAQGDNQLDTDACGLGGTSRLAFAPIRISMMATALPLLVLRQ